MSRGQAGDESDSGSRMLLPLLLPAPLNPEDPGEARPVGHGQEIGCDNELAHLGRPSMALVDGLHRPLAQERMPLDLGRNPHITAT